jgi:hypothetical protein
MVFLQPDWSKKDREKERGGEKENKRSAECGMRSAESRNRSGDEEKNEDRRWRIAKDED